MKDSELNQVVQGLVASAIQYADGELSPERATATDYYFGRPFGNEEKGRSAVVLTEVRDGVNAIIPPMLRVIFGSERVVEFRPDRKETAAAAEQATDYVNYVFSEDNPGFLSTLDVLKDGLVRKIGIFGWSWDDTTAVTQHKLENVGQAQLELLGADEELELTRIEESGTMVLGAGQPDVPLFTVEFTKTVKDGRASVYAIPPEEFIFTREARDLDDAIFVGHRTRKTRGELIAMGISATVIDEHGGDDPALQDNEEEIARRPDDTGTEEVEAGEANDKILYIRGFAHVDYDGDGIAELREIHIIGGGYHIVSHDPADEVPFAIFCPDPEPHNILGQSWADRLMDMQKVKSALLRAGLDSLSASIHPRTWYVEGQVNQADILNTAIGAPVRMKTPGAAGEWTHSFTGKEAFPVLQYCDDVVERRTGQTKGAAMMDADALQSSTKSAVTAAVTAAQAQQELVVRIFAEGTLKRVFAGLLKLLVTHQPRARMVRLRGQWVDVDPRSWDATMDVQVNVALGAGLIDEKVATLQEVAQVQGMILEKLGPDNPIVGLKEYRDTLAMIVELRGFKNSDRFFKQVTQQQLDQAAQAAAQKPQQETPEMTIAKAQIQIETMKAQAKMATDKMNAERDLMKAKAELEMKRREILLEDDRVRDKQAADAIVALRKIEADTGVSQADAIADIQNARDTAMRGPDEIAPRVKRVKVERDHTGRLVGATVHHEEGI